MKKAMAHALPLMLFLLICSAALHAEETAVSLPRPARLEYAVKAEMGGGSLSGTSYIQWTVKEGRYTVKSEAAVSVLGKVRYAESAGRIAENGLVPDTYTEKRFRKDETVTHFNYETGAISFRKGKSAELKENVRDTASVIWQLAAAGKADPERFSPGAVWKDSVAGHSRVEEWILTAEGEETISVPAGNFKTVHFSRTGRKNQEMHVWFAPEADWYPVKILFDEPGGLRFLQDLQKIIYE